MYINGEWVGADAGKTFEVFNPANGKTLDNVADGGPEETRRAIELAHKAYGTWCRTTGRHRADLLAKLALVMTEAKCVQNFFQSETRLKSLITTTGRISPR